MIGEDVRARPAIERLTTKWLEDAAPGTSRDEMRDFVIGIAKRNDTARPLNTLDAKTITRAIASTIVDPKTVFFMVDPLNFISYEHFKRHRTINECLPSFVRQRKHYSKLLIYSSQHRKR